MLGFILTGHSKLKLSHGNEIILRRPRRYCDSELSSCFTCRGHKDQLNLHLRCCFPEGRRERERERERESWWLSNNYVASTIRPFTCLMKKLSLAYVRLSARFDVAFRDPQLFWLLYNHNYISFILGTKNALKEAISSYVLSFSYIRRQCRYSY